ncbi:MAG: MMPL family transporter [Candidatus Micrarchaeota archaeon]
MGALDRLSDGVGEKLDVVVPKYSAFLENERWPLLLIFMIFITFMAYHAINLQVDSSQKSFFYENDPIILRNNLVDANFNSADAMTIFIRVDKGSTEIDRVDSVRDPQVAEYIATMAEKFADKGFVDMVATPADNPYLINPEGSSALMLVYANIGDEDIILGERTRQIEEVIENTKTPSGIKTTAGGSPVIFSEVSRLLFQDLISTGIASLLIIALCIRLFYGSNQMTIINIFMICCILSSIFGAMNLMGVPLNIATALIAALTIGIGVDYTLHLQNGFIRGSGSRREIVTNTLLNIGPPLSMSFFTTFIGFFSLFFAGSAVMEDLAIATCLGILFVFFYNITLTPILFFMFGLGDAPFKEEEREEREPSKLSGELHERLFDISEYIGNHTGKFLALALLFVIIVASGMMMLKTKMSYSDFIPSDNPIMIDLVEQGDAFPGSSNSMSIIVQADDVLEYDVLREVDAFEKRLMTLEYVESVDSPVDAIKAMNDGQIPESRARIEHPGVGNDLTMMRINLGYSGQASIDEDILIGQLLPAIEGEFPEKYETYFAGRIAYNVGERSTSQAGSGAVTLFSFALIFVVLTLYFRSIVTGTLMLIPIALALMCTMGLNGWSGVPFSQITSSIFGIIIGIGIDFSIHTGSEIKKLLNMGVGYAQAVAGSLDHLAKLLFLTSLTTILGFLSMRIAQLSFLRDLGVSLAYGIMLAFFFSMIVLPGLIVANEKMSAKAGEIAGKIRKRIGR